MTKNEEMEKLPETVYVYDTRNKQTKDKAYVSTLKHGKKLSGIRTWIFIFISLLANKNGSSLSLDRNFRCTLPYLFFLTFFLRGDTLREEKKRSWGKSRSLTDPLLHSAHKNISTLESGKTIGPEMLTTICRHNVGWQPTNSLSLPMNGGVGGSQQFRERKQNNTKVWLCTQQSIRQKITDEEKINKTRFWGQVLIIKHSRAFRRTFHTPDCKTISPSLTVTAGQAPLAKLYGISCATATRQFRQILTLLRAQGKWLGSFVRACTEPHKPTLRYSRLLISQALRCTKRCAWFAL